ncbi:hypothetical protein EOA19_06180 [Mesorhizobium sp. M7A.F.Ca.US.010.02.1.1]|nr:hypothetical protein EOA19_06180 [Mesorhizobium sp. M7A.F.Ca.US.010.02.1.1]
MVLDIWILSPAMPQPTATGERGDGQIEGGALKLPISPLAGEMAGRPEGGVKDCQPWPITGNEPLN